MKLRRTGRFVALAAATSLVLAACGGSTDDTGTDEDADAAENDAADEDAADADADAIHLRVANLLPPGGSKSNVVEWAMAEIEEASGGTVTSEIAFGGSLLAGTDTLPGLHEGRAEAGVIVPAYFPNELPLASINSVPLPDGNQAARIRAFHELYEQNDAFRAEFDEADLVPIGFLPTNTSVVALVEPIESLDDLEGLRLRIPSEPQSVAFQELGAEPVFLASEEVYESLQRDIVDGVTYPFDTAINNGVTEVASYLTHDVGESGLGILAVSKSVYDSLPADAQTAIDEIKEGFYAEADRQLVETDAAACDEFLEGGGSVIILPDEDRQQMAELAASVSLDAWIGQVTEAGVDEDVAREFWEEYLEATERFTPESDYEDGLRLCAERQ